MNQEDKNVKVVQSIDRALNLLQVISRQTEPVPVSDLAALTDLNRTTVWRILLTLEQRQFVEYDPISKGYQIGYGAMKLIQGKSVLYTSFIRLARPILNKLMETVNETVFLSVPIHFGTLTIDQVNPGHRIQVMYHQDETLPLHCTSNGKIYLSQLSDRELELILKENLTAYTEHTMTDADKLRTEILDIRKNGYAFCLGELEEGENGVSVSINDVFGKCRGYLSVAGPEFRLTKEKMYEAIPALQQAADDIQHQLNAS
ncbi:hypothetical protein N781_15755 [Pontibacillus halophilus JSM 076056 = DSM 19796]|uniref:IclR family transcriptional regulator n=1 Tax=Pontibacillus halophilus JSM 076056 = DSM 19796 TaxID=1385510 RepID=A0A0A5GNI3_9BACI